VNCSGKELPTGARTSTGRLSGLCCCIVLATGATAGFVASPHQLRVARPILPILSAPCKHEPQFGLDANRHVFLLVICHLSISPAASLASSRATPLIHLEISWIRLIPKVNVGIMIKQESALRPPLLPCHCSSAATSLQQRPTCTGLEQGIWMSGGGTSRTWVAGHRHLLPLPVCQKGQYLTQSSSNILCIAHKPRMYEIRT
jgi:hypothetical protein